MALKCTPNIRNYPAYNNQSNLSGVLYSFMTFKSMLIAANHHADDLPKTGMLEKEQREWFKNCEPEIIAC